MNKLFAFIGATIGGYAGWWIGAKAGIMTAFFVSIIGTAAGGYYARKMAKQYET